MSSLISNCHVLQCVAVCCSVLQCVEVRCSALQCVAVCRSVLQRVAARCSVSQYVAVCRSVLWFVVGYCNVMQCVAVCCSVLQCVSKDSRLRVILSFSLSKKNPHAKGNLRKRSTHTVAQTHRMSHLYKSYFAKEPYNSWLFFETRPAT